MFKIGRKTKEWNKVRTQLKREFLEMGITTCEIRLPECTGSCFLTWAHTRKRRNVTDLSRVVLACVNCHFKVEYECKKWTGMGMTEFLEKIISNRYETLKKEI